MDLFHAGSTSTPGNVTTLANLNSIQNFSSTFVTQTMLELNQINRNLYSGPTPLPIHPPYVSAAAPNPNRQYIIDFPVCIPMPSTVETAAMLAAFSNPRNPPSRSVTVVGPYDLPENFPAPNIPRPQPAANNQALNQLKETIKKAQQRKRQRDLEQQAGDQPSNSSSDDSVSTFQPAATVNIATPSSSRAEDGCYPRRAKVPRTEENTSQEDSSEGLSTPNESLLDSTNRANNNQQVMGPVRQHEQRNCQYCTTALPMLTTPSNVVPRRDVIGGVPVMPRITPAITAASLLTHNTQPATQPTMADHMELLRRHNQRVMASGTISGMSNHGRMIHEAISLFQPSQVTQYRQPLQYPHYFFNPTVIMNEVLAMNAIQTETLLRDRMAMDRNIMFGLGEDIPIGASTQDIDKNTKLIQFERENKDEKNTEPERCTVCLSEFETNEKVRLMRCKHIFHPACIDRWLMYNKKCPVCRMCVDEQQTTETQERSNSIIVLE